jgi:signal transduction histidine kinase
MREVSIPGIVIGGEVVRGAKGVDYRAQCGDHPCLLRLAADVHDPCAPQRDQLFRAFRSESIALARARHSTIPAVFETGAVDERPFAILESCDGETLAERLRWGPLPEPSIVALGQQILGGLREAHRRGLVHGHLTPAEIVFMNGHGDVRIAGFGSPSVSQQGARDYRSDLAALGRVLYECACGRAASAGLTQDRRGELTELPELSRGNEPLTSPELSALVVRLLRSESPAAKVDVDSLLRDFDRLQAGSPPEHAPRALPESVGNGAPQEEEVAFVARGRELAILRDVWEDVRLGRSAIAHLRGAAGSGKSRLLRAFAQRASTEPQLVLAARCVPNDARPFAALGELLNSRAHRALGGEAHYPESAIRNAGHELAPLLKGLSPELTRLFGGAAELGATHEMQALFAEGAAEFLARLLRAAGTALVVIDDLQWMDAGSRTVLTRVADRARHSKTLFLVASRTDGESAAAVDAFFRPIRALTHVDLTLGPLACSECRQLVEAYLGATGVPDDIVEPLTSLGDGTPLSILEVLHAIGGEGLLAPAWGQWRLDRDALERMQFPAHTREILARRVAELSPNARSVMSAAAVLGLTFEESFVARIVEGADCPSALDEARHARVLVGLGSGDPRFVHEAVRETLLGGLRPQEIQAIQQRIAEALDVDGASDTPSVCRRAAAYAAGDWTRASRRVFETNYEAARRTFSSFDNDRALSFLTVAERVAAETKIDPDTEFYQTLGEVYVRRGALSRARDYFHSALVRAREPLQRGILYSRMAWVDYTKGDTELAWGGLQRAFESLSEKMPKGKPWELARAVVSMRTVQRELEWTRLSKKLSDEEKRRIEALCAIHYQAARLALETDKPARFLSNVMQSLDRAERLGPSRALVRSLLLYAFTQVSLGLRAVGLSRLGQAEGMAETIRDPVILAYCQQIRAVILAWAGDINASLETGSKLLLEQGHWIEVSEYCSLCWNQALMLGLRGQAEEAWQWIARGIDKIRHEVHTPEIGVFLRHTARAALETLGRAAELSRHFQAIGVPESTDSLIRGPHYRFAFGSRVRVFSETGHLGAEFEALVREVRSTGIDPARAHLALCEFYVHVAHARVHQCLRREESERRGALVELAESVRELRAMARLPVLNAHLWVVEGYQALFDNSFLRATLAFSRADDLAQRENCPWVLYAVARGRAHLHKMQGRSEPALAQASLAATIAEKQGYAHKLRWVREEFPALIPASVPHRERSVGETEMDSAVSRRLAQIGRASPTDANLTEQAKRIIDELVQCVRGERGVLLLSPEDGGVPSVIAARDALGRDLDRSTAPGHDLVRRAFQSGSTVLEHGNEAAPTADSIRTAIALPLESRERVIGVAYLEIARGQLSVEEERILEILVNQAAVAIELTRALRARTEELRERKLLEDELRQAQKMEAVGRLAGTIAHDFNNLLAIISASAESSQVESDETAARAFALIREACNRGAALTGQLLTFSRRQASAPTLLHLNALLESWIPLIRRLLAENIEVVTRFESEHDAILADPNRLEQVLLNLAANARDAMPAGGRVTIATRDTYPPAGERAPGELPSDYVVLEVEDTGEGMEPEVLRQAFEPFFTTKAQGKGTGLGLATVYGTVRQMRGRITVDSARSRNHVSHVFSSSGACPRCGSGAAKRTRMDRGSPSSPAGAARVPRCSPTDYDSARRRRETHLDVARAWIGAPRVSSRRRAHGRERPRAFQARAAQDRRRRHRCAHARNERPAARRAARGDGSSSAAPVHLGVHGRRGRAGASAHERRASSETIQHRRTRRSDPASDGRNCASPSHGRQGWGLGPLSSGRGPFLCLQPVKLAGPADWPRRAQSIFGTRMISTGYSCKKDAPSSRTGACATTPRMCTRTQCVR